MLILGRPRPAMGSWLSDITGSVGTVVSDGINIVKTTIAVPTSLAFSATKKVVGTVAAPVIGAVTGPGSTAAPAAPAGYYYSSPNVLTPLPAGALVAPPIPVVDNSSNWLLFGGLAAAAGLVLLIKKKKASS